MRVLPNIRLIFTSLLPPAIEKGESQICRNQPRGRMDAIGTSVGVVYGRQIIENLKQSSDASSSVKLVFFHFDQILYVKIKLPVI